MIRGCALQPMGSLDPKTIEAVVDAAIYQRGTTKRFVTSAVLAFADEAGARAAVGAYLAPSWSSCRVDDKTANAKAQPGGQDTSWRAGARDSAGPGGLEGVVRFQFQAVVEGELRDANGYEAVLFYRVGTFVLMVAVEGSAQQGDPKDLDKKIDQELHAATVKALNRLN